MKPRIVLGAALLAVLVAEAAYVLVPARVEAQQAVDKEQAPNVESRSRRLREVRAGLQEKFEQADAELRDLAASEESLKRQLEQIAKRRSELNRRRVELQARIDATGAEIDALNSSATLGTATTPARAIGRPGTAPSVKHYSVEEKLDQILNRLSTLERRVDSLESVKRPPIPPAPPK